MAKLPSLEDFVCILQKCRKNKDLEAAKRFQVHIRDTGLESHCVLGNYLVPTLIECGSLPDALEVFNKLLHRNEVSWTSLIQGYVEYGEPQHGLNLYQKMQEDFVYPSKYTFLVLLKACVKLSSTERGQKIHSDIVKNGFDDNSFIGNTLVDMYAKCGSLLESQGVFDELLVRDVVSWNALVAGYAENGLGKEALTCLERMYWEGVSPDITTFLCVLKACTSIQATDSGREVHVEIIKEEFERDPFIGNTLVDMYAKCGSLEEARDVFEELPIRDIVSWNALLTGYAEHGHGYEVLNCLKEMEQEGISPNTGTFVRTLQACGMIGAVDRGQEFHTEIVQRGFDNEFFVGNTLVDMYSKCGLLEDSQKVFDRLVVRDAVSWNALISGYCGHGLGEEALECLWQMRFEGVSPDSATFSSSLKACGSIGAMAWGREIHAELLIYGYQGNLFAGSTLVDMYAKCGSLKDSQDVFDKLLVRDVVSWNALISGYADEGLSKEALDCLEQMQCEGVSPDPGTFVCSLQACGGMGVIDKARELHAEIAKEGFEGVPCVNSALVNMYAKSGFLAEACEVFDEQIAHEVISWTALIAGYAEEGLSEEVSDCLERMQMEGVSPNVVTFVSILKACRVGSLDRGRELHVVIAQKGFEKDPCISSALMGMYTKCGKLAEAREMFEKLPVRDVILWTALIAGYAEHGLGKEALSCLERMQQEGFSPDLLTYVCSLQACGSMKAIDMGQKLYSEVAKKGLERDVYIGNALVDMYAKCAMLAELWEVFEKLPVQDLVSWTSLIGGYAEHGHVEEALDYFHYMQLEGVYPDVVAWNAVISGYAEHNESEKAFELCGQMQEQGLSPDSAIFLNVLKACRNAVALEVGKRVHAQISRSSGLDHSKVALETALVDMYGKCGSMYDAVQVFNSMPARVLMAWNALITGYAIQGESKLVFFLFERMMGAGIQPDGDTFCSVLIACSHAGLLVESHTYFEVMNRKFCIIPTIKHHTCMVDLLGRAGHLDDAVLMLEKIPFQPDLVLLHAMLGACRRWGSVELGREIFEVAVSLDEKRSAAYILMSNIYADPYM